jgi:excinuclease ABC subunit C
MDDRLREKLDRLPHAPGVYVMRARDGSALYVGKAADLHSRVRSYFAAGTSDGRFFVPLLDEALGDMETVVTANDREALLLENSLIKELRPRYNVRLRDDKDYLSIRIDESATWPRLELVRRPRPDGARYFGPYASARPAREAVRTLNRLLRLRPCRDSAMRGRCRPCLVHQIGRCDAPCVFPVDPQAYRTAVRRAAALLEGRGDAVGDEIRTEMRAASATLDFERAARLRDQVDAIARSSFGQPQQVVEVSRIDRDVVGLHRDGPAAQVVVLEVRRGKLVACRSHAFAGLEVPDAAVLGGFLTQRYGAGAAAPDEVLLPLPIADPEMLESFLTGKRGRRVRVLVPRRGRLRRLVELARANAEQRFREESRDRQSASLQAEAVARALGLRAPPCTVECVDVSHWGGHAEKGATVAAVVAMRDGEFDKARYRRFRLRAEHGGDDCAAMREVVRRRFERARAGDARWAPPDLFVVDGGRGQLAVAAAVVRDLGVTGTALAAIAKPAAAPAGEGPRGAVPDTLYTPNRKNPLRLRPGSPALHLLARLRDETHRFAVEYQGRVRGTRRLTDRLAGIPGVGPVTRRRLLAAFGSVARLAQATAGEIAAVEGVTERQARAVAERLAQPEDASARAGPDPGGGAR